jgi:tetratricopeptide (TPR) repeat protein
MDTLKVFISGTMRDLKKERDIVAEAVAGLRYQAVRAETLGAVDRSSREACLEMARQCDIYIGLYGDRYGWVPDGDTCSVTEQEYNEARRLGKPMLIYVKGDAREPGREEAQQAFLDRVLEFEDGYFARLHFTELADLREAVQRDLLRLVTEIVRQRGRAAIPTPLRPPAPPRHFVGRAAQIKELRRMLGGGGTAVISGAVAKLVGMGGLGKTALAAYAAQELAAEFPDGVLWAELHRSSTDDILTAIAGFYHLDLSRCPDRATKAAAVCGVLEKKRALLVLDNAQHNDQLEPFQMGAGARCAVLVTTRRDDLAALRHAQRVGLPLLSESEALDLLRGIAGKKRVEAEPEVAEEILAMVGYLPLAVDIVASRLRDRPEWSLGEMQRRLADSSRRMEELEIGEDYGVRLSFDMSYEALKPEERQFFAQMGVFGGLDFDVTAAAVVAQVGEREAEGTLEQLRHLALAQPGRRASRYALHPLLRDYACAHLDDQNAHQRMAAHYLAVAREAGGKLKGREIEDGLAVLDEEISNVRAGQAWAAQTDSEKAQELTRDYISKPVVDYFELRAHWDEWIEWNQAGLRACEELGDEHGTGMMTGRLGLVYMHKGEWEWAIELYQRALSIMEKAGDIHGMAKAYNNLGLVYMYKGEWERTIEFYQKSLEADEKVGDVHGMAKTWGNLGEVYRMKGEWEWAIEFYEKSLDTYEKLGDIHGMAITYMNVGNLYSQQGKWDEAIEKYQKSLGIQEKLGDIYGMAQTYSNLGNVYWQKWEWEHAIEFYQSSLETYEKVGDIHGLAITYMNVGNLCLQQGKWEQAIEFYQRSLETRGEIRRHSRPSPDL